MIHWWGVWVNRRYLRQAPSWKGTTRSVFTTERILNDDLLVGPLGSSTLVPSNCPTGRVGVVRFPLREESLVMADWWDLWIHRRYLRQGHLLEWYYLHCRHYGYGE